MKKSSITYDPCDDDAGHFEKLKICFLILQNRSPICAAKNRPRNSF